ncbi:MAG TPA: hypothetical protein VMH02_04505 [Verrucomicrobiae bacterium]|nr:hypothetical protein [Verrucomicrobiae bacterium]
MPVFPPGTPVALILDGRPVVAYVQAYLASGRVYAPVEPLLTRLADRLWFDGNVLVIERNGRRVRVALSRGNPQVPDAAYVAIGPLLRALGASVSYVPQRRSLEIRTERGARFATPSPYDAAAPSVAPRAVFTPQPVPTPRPAWTGSPLPRRTPLPASAPPRR